MRPVDHRSCLAALVFGVVFALSYAAQRLASAWGGEVNPELVFATEHIPYYWRCGLALLHALAVALLVQFLVPTHRAEALLARAPLVVALLGGAAALSMVLVP